MEKILELQKHLLEIDTKKAMNSELVSAHIVCNVMKDILNELGASPIDINIWHAHNMRFKTELQNRNFHLPDENSQIYDIIKALVIYGPETIMSVAKEVLSSLSKSDIINIIDVLLEDYVHNEDVLILLTDELKKRK